MSNPPPSTAASENIVMALGQAFKNQTGDSLAGSQLATLLMQNMDQLGVLTKQGKINPTQIAQVRKRPTISNTRLMSQSLGIVVEGVCGELQEREWWE